MSTHLTLVRHGTTEWMEKGITHGQMDAPLSSLGIQQVKAAAAYLQGRKFNAFYTSPSGRTLQTASIIGESVGLFPTPLGDLMEQNFGVAEGSTIHHFPRWGHVIYYVITRFYLSIGWSLPRYKNGESFRDLHERAVKALDLILKNHSGGSVLVVSHYGMISTILREVTGKRFDFYPLAPASITEVELENGRNGKILSIRPGSMDKFEILAPANSMDAEPEKN